MPDDKPFIHLHVHTEYSLLDGLSKIPKLVSRAQELQMPALAITDHGTMFGVIDFYRACKKAGIKPIIGMEAYLARRSMQDRDSKLDARPFHLLLLAKDETGYKNLLKIASIAQLEGYYYRPRVDRDFLASHAEGLVATSGCLAAQIPSMIMEGRDDEAKEMIGWYQDVFGADNFFLELQQHDIPELRTLNRWLFDYAKSGHSKVGLVATNDVHYVRESDADPHDTLLCIQTSALKSEPERLRMSDPSYYLTDQAEMWGYFQEAPEALYNTVKIAEMCNINLDRKGYHLPNFPVPDGHTADTYLRKLAFKGLEWRYNSRASAPEVRERLEYELNVIHTMGFDTYFLIVWDLCEFARHADIWWNVRGSGAGSVTAYCLGITNIDPIQNNLLFERFLNPGRVSMPDIDIDYPDDRRSEMIAYTARKYGEERVAAIITFGTLGAKAAVRDVGRALGVPLEIVNQAARLIPTEPKPKPVKEYVELNPDLKKMYESDNDIRHVIDTAEHLQGVSRHASTHAAGIIVGDKPLVEYLPLHRQTKAETGEENSLKQVTQFPMETCESIGLLKVDFLGLSTLTILRRACDLIERHHGIKYNMSNIPYRPNDNDEHNLMLDETFEMIGRGETVGVFQVESSGMQQMLRGMRPKKFEHIVAAISLYRPGPMDYIPTYNHRLHGVEPIEYKHPNLESILSETYGIIIYQEQIMQIASNLFGYSLGDADLMRRAVSKKKKEDLHKHRGIFIENGPKYGVDEESAVKIFDDIEFFANYGFNKCLVASTEIIDAETGRIVTIGDVASGKASLSQTVTCDTDALRLRGGRVTAAMSNGVKPVYRLMTCAGRTITATANHPFYTFDGWRNLGELQSGDRIATPRCIPVEGKQIWPAHKLIALGQQLAQRNAALTIPSAQPFAPAAGEPAVMPADVFSLTNGNLALLLATLWEKASAAYGDELSLATGSDLLARQVQHLLLRFGIVAERSGDVLTIRGEDEIRFTEMIVGTNGEFAPATRAADHSDIYWDEIVSIEDAGEEETFDLTIESTHNFVANDIIVHNSHAADYGVITVQTAFLKAHYPAEYMTALLSVYFDDATKVTTFLTECKRLNIPILPPDVNYSMLDFDIQRQADGRRGIRFGLAAIKNAGVGALQNLISAREEGGPFRDLIDFCTRVDLRTVGKRTVESLTKVGAMAAFGTRPQLLGALDRMMSFSAEHHKAKDVGQFSLFGGMGGETQDDLLKNLPSHDEATQREMLNWEKELLGLYVTSHPIDPVLELLSHGDVHYTHQLKEADSDRQDEGVRLVALVAGVRKIPTKNRDMMAIVQLEDRYGTIDAVLFPRTWKQFESLIEDGRVLLFRGKLDVSRGDPQIICESVTQDFTALTTDSAFNFAPEDDHAPVWADEPSFDPDPPPAIPNGNDKPNGNGHRMETASTSASSQEPPSWNEAPPTWADGMELMDAPPTWDDEEAAPPPPRRVTVRLERSRDGDREKDKRRLKKVYGLLTQYPGSDQFAVEIESGDGDVYEIEFPNNSTDYCDELRIQLEALVGQHNINVTLLV